jgi:hypothetical protein
MGHPTRGPHLKVETWGTRLWRVEWMGCFGLDWLGERKWFARSANTPPFAKARRMGHPVLWLGWVWGLGFGFYGFYDYGVGGAAGGEDGEEGGAVFVLGADDGYVAGVGVGG